MLESNRSMILRPSSAIVFSGLLSVILIPRPNRKAVARAVMTPNSGGTSMVIKLVSLLALSAAAVTGSAIPLITVLATIKAKLPAMMVEP